MRHNLLSVLLALILVSTVDAGWFGNDDQLNKVEHDLHEERQTSGDWMVVAGILGIGCAVLFGIGAAIGSGARKAVKR